MPGILKYVIDGLVGAALFAALMLVFLTDLIWFSRPTGPSANTLPNVSVIEAGARNRNEGKRLKLAVTPTQKSLNSLTNQDEPWDDMGKLLKELGEGYRFDTVEPQELLLKPKKLNEYDVLFLTCAEGGQELSNTLRDFVADGGILYASDWRYEAVAAAFPDVVDTRTQGKGAGGDLEADIVDAALSQALGSKKIHLRFDLSDWKTAAFAGSRVKTLIQGTYDRPKAKGKLVRDQATAPLMVKFTHGKGTVIFTSFHNEKQNSEVEKKLLQYLVFSLVTAGVDAEINSTLNQGGFTPQPANLLSTPKRNQSIVKTYENSRVGDLRFALGFRNEGARLRFNVKSPDGKEYTWEGKSTVILEVPQAAVGTWTYTVTDLELPYENFPFTVTVGEKK